MSARTIHPAARSRYHQDAMEAERDAERSQAKARVAQEKAQLARELNHANTIYTQRTGHTFVGAPDLGSIRSADDVAKARRELDIIRHNNKLPKPIAADLDEHDKALSDGVPYVPKVRNQAAPPMPASGSGGGGGSGSATGGVADDVGAGAVAGAAPRSPSGGADPLMGIPESERARAIAGGEYVPGSYAPAQPVSQDEARQFGTRKDPMLSIGENMVNAAGTKATAAWQRQLDKDFSGMRPGNPLGDARTDTRPGAIPTLTPHGLGEIYTTEVPRVSAGYDQIVSGIQARRQAARADAYAGSLAPGQRPTAAGMAAWNKANPVNFEQEMRDVRAEADKAAAPQIQKWTPPPTAIDPKDYAKNGVPTDAFRALHTPEGGVGYYTNRAAPRTTAPAMSVTMPDGKVESTPKRSLTPRSDAVRGAAFAMDQLVPKIGAMGAVANLVNPMNPSNAVGLAANNASGPKAPQAPNNAGPTGAASVPNVSTPLEAIPQPGDAGFVGPLSTQNKLDAASRIDRQTQEKNALAANAKAASEKESRDTFDANLKLEAAQRRAGTWKGPSPFDGDFSWTN